MPNLATFNLTIKQREILRFPESSGSMLRGAFGTALRELACQTDLPDCKICPMRSQCAYVQIFESQLLAKMGEQIPNPYTIRLPNARQSVVNAGQMWTFGMTLVGEAIAHYPLMIQAWRLACQNGIGGGKQRSQSELTKVINQGQIVYFHATQKTLTVPDWQIKRVSVLPPKEGVKEITLHFLTSFRIQYQGKVAHHAHQFEPIHLLVNLYNRIQNLAQHHDKRHDKSQPTWEIGYADFIALKTDLEKLTLTADVTPTKVVRHSSRQQQKIALFGLTGDVHIAGDSELLSRLLPMLWLGQYLHVGKSTTLGMGQYQLQIR